jgi:hypothetical protein
VLLGIINGFRLWRFRRVLVTNHYRSVGNDGTGKTSLIVKLQTGVAEVKKGHAMEYSYINVYDEERDGI